MKYILTAGWDDGIADLTARLARELSGGKKVLWLMSGGSNVQPGVRVMENISTDLSKNLTITLADERHGPPGHAESNWHQLLQAGLDVKAAQTRPVLKAGENFAQTTERYNRLLHKLFAEHDIAIAQLGVGPDGHIAGILPGSPAISETEAWVVGFDDAPLKRMTMTFPALRQLDLAYVFAFGAPKQRALTQLKSRKLPVEKQPAQVLKELPEVYLYSDLVGEHV